MPDRKKGIAKGGCSYKAAFVSQKVHHPRNYRPLRVLSRGETLVRGGRGSTQSFVIPDNLIRPGSINVATQFADDVAANAFAWTSRATAFPSWWLCEWVWGPSVVALATQASRGRMSEHTALLRRLSIIMMSYLDARFSAKSLEGAPNG